MAKKKQLQKPTKPPKEADITLRVEFYGTKGDIGERLLNWLLSVGSNTMPNDFISIKIHKVDETEWSTLRARAYKKCLQELKEEKKDVTPEVSEREQPRVIKQKVRRKKSETH